MSEEWGPWIEHDGKGCPCVGMYVQAEYRFSQPSWANGFVAKGLDSWLWNAWANHILRYRIRKPHALIQLIEMVENLPAPTEQVDA